MRPTLPRLAGLLASLLAGLALALFVVGLLSARPARAQDLGLEITKTLRGGADVQVGQILEFTIRITNSGSLPLVELDLVDEFVSSIVAPVGSGPYAQPDDPPLSDTSPFSYDGVETITWSLLGGGKTLGPGESLAVVVRLRAVHPTEDLQTVNRARIARAIRSSGESSGGGSASAPASPAGARLPMTKSLGAPAPVQAGLPITFTIVITNDSLVDIVSLPLRDVFNPAALRFVSANPPPDSVDQVGGVLTWDDLLATTGRSALAPGESITVQTFYIALRDITSAVNTAEVSGAKDEYGNAVQPRHAEAPIRIVGATETPAPAGAAPTDAPTETPTPFATAGPRLTQIAGRTATAVAMSAPTATPTATLTDTAQAAPAEAATPAMPASLPNTGGGDPSPLAWLIVGLALLGGALALRRSR
jgi:LPXTG-motif cell wall-anchored protein